MNGGRNYNGPKVGKAALVKFGYLLETPCIQEVLVFVRKNENSDNLPGADNQQERPFRKKGHPQRLHAERFN